MPDIPPEVYAAADAALDQLPQPANRFERDRWRIASHIALEAAASLLERAICRKMARDILALDAEDHIRTRHVGPYGDMRTSLRRIARGEPLPDAVDLRGGEARKARTVAEPDLTYELDAAEEIVTGRVKSVETQWGVSRPGPSGWSLANCGTNEELARADAAEGRGEVVRRTVTYGPWEDATGSAPSAGTGESP